jgi:hypothetical protein
MYRVIEAIHSHAHGKVFPAGAQITERDFPPHAIAAMLHAGVVEDMSAPAPAAEPEPSVAAPELDAWQELVEEDGESEAAEIEQSDIPEWLDMVEQDAPAVDEPRAESAPQKKRGGR